MYEMINQLIEQDPLLSVRRTNDTRRYIIAKWNESHDEPLDEGELSLFLCDEKHGSLTDGQKAFARECRGEMRNVYAAVVFRGLQYGEMLRNGMVRDMAEYCDIFAPGFAEGGGVPWAFDKAG